MFVMNGAPIDEPVVGYGPFVMNTTREIQQAFADFHAGRLGTIPTNGESIVIDTRTAPYAALVLRVALGVMFIAHSLILKYFILRCPARRSSSSRSACPPRWRTSRSGPSCSAVSRWSRASRLAGWPWRSIPILAGATWVHIGNGWVFSNANGGWEYPVFLIAGSSRCSQGPTPLEAPGTIRVSEPCNDSAYAHHAQEIMHEALLRTRRLLAVPAHRVARARHRRRAEEGQHQGQDHRRRRRLLEGQPARLRAGARARQRPDPDRRPGDRAVPRRPEARRRPRAEERHLRALPPAGVAQLPHLRDPQAASRRSSSRTRPRTTRRSRRRTSPRASTGSTSSSPARTT